MNRFGLLAATSTVVLPATLVAAGMASAPVAAAAPKPVVGKTCAKIGKVANTRKYGQLKCRKISGQKTWQYTAKSGPRSLRVGKDNRRYRINIPQRMRGPVSLVINLHGNPSNIAEQRRLTSYDAVSNQYGFLTVTPQGLYSSWSDGRGTTQAQVHGVNDIRFFSRLIDSLVAKYGVDRKRVYVAGFSNGAFMAERLGCELSNKVAAIAAVEGTRPVGSTCNPSRQVSVMQVHGTSDHVVPFDGGNVPDDVGSSAVQSAPEVVNRWRSIDGCGAVTTTRLPDNHDGTNVDVETSSCANGTAVTFYKVWWAGHTWPGGYQYFPANQIGLTTRQFSASTDSWLFFASHPRV